MKHYQANKNMTTVNSIPDFKGKEKRKTILFQKILFTLSASPWRHKA
jgi:hypothetical protein